MCLSKIDKQFSDSEINNNTEYTGYKVFLENQNTGELRFEYYHLHRNDNNSNVPFNKWIEANNILCVDENGIKVFGLDSYYQPGFHIIPSYNDILKYRLNSETEDDIWKHVVVKVKYRGITTKGKQAISIVYDEDSLISSEMINCDVAKFMYIEEILTSE